MMMTIIMMMMITRFTEFEKYILSVSGRSIATSRAAHDINKSRDIRMVQRRHQFQLPQGAYWQTVRRRDNDLLQRHHSTCTGKTKTIKIPSFV